MRRAALLICIGIILGIAAEKSYRSFKKNFRVASEQKPYRWHWNDWRERQKLGRKQADVVFVGDSLIKGGYWAEWFDCPSIVNRGIDGERSQQLLERIGDIKSLQPKSVFVMTGTNDITGGVPLPQTMQNMTRIYKALQPARVLFHTIPNQPEFNSALKSSGLPSRDISSIEMEKYHPTARGFRQWRDVLRGRVCR